MKLEQISFTRIDNQLKEKFIHYIPEMKIKKTTNKDRLTVAINVRIEESHAKIMDEIIRKSFGDQISRSQFLKIALVEKLQRSEIGR